MKLYKTTIGILLQNDKGVYLLHEDWDVLINRKNLYSYLLQQARHNEQVSPETFSELIKNDLFAPIGSQEVWAAGVTYLRSRDARMEESKAAGGGDFYDRVYSAERPELFFKALPQRVVGDHQEVNIRRDSTWNVPEPELTLYINTFGEIQGYTIGNDMSSRSIEGENPLYLPQAKSYERSTALGPCLYIPQKPISKDTTISISIKRRDKEVFKDAIQLNRMKRELTELAAFLFRELEFPSGCYLMTGTGMVPGNEFTLQVGDIVSITIEGIGTLTNTVAMR
ncbi:MAG TPA: fumarylacetoacetate hydrolase family protein [Chitinophagaceae bacterium]|nr:fumarylacetoacetate hydrolase family protein [Chitinophagaceae bacterium]